jgi:hypothetical protein
VVDGLKGFGTFANRRVARGRPPATSVGSGSTRMKGDNDAIEPQITLALMSRLVRHIDPTRPFVVQNPQTTFRSLHRRWVVGDADLHRALILRHAREVVIDRRAERHDLHAGRGSRTRVIEFETCFAPEP